MKITLYDWCGCSGFKGTEFEHNTQIYGGIDKAFEIAQKLFTDYNLNVMLLHRENLIILAIDTRSFGQR